MNFLDFRNENIDRCCFSVYGLGNGSRGAVSSNLSRWTSENKLIKLRKGWYAFPERTVDFSDRMFIANSIYSPSYVSLFTALSYYEMIPESVTAVTSVSTLKTAEFNSGIGLFSYRSLKPSLFWGYEPVTGPRQLPYLLASAEKALLDLLYLYPYYSTDEEIEGLRLDEDYMRKEFNWGRMEEYLARASSKALAARVAIVKRIYY